MASSKQEGTSAAADQLGSMSLGDSAERKENDTENSEENGTTPTKLCSACGKKSNTLKKCNGCMCVWYCDKKCQNKHRKEHKKECRPIKQILDQRGGKLNLGTELDFGPIGKLPPREECPICMHVLPSHAGLQTYFACCGKTICCACDHQHRIKNKGRSRTCAFCRIAAPESDEEILLRQSKRVELKDPEALLQTALCYRDGLYGLPVDQAKCIELLRESADLGCPPAQYQLGAFYYTGNMGLEQNEEEELKYYKKAAEGGYLKAVHNVGCMAYEKVGPVAAICHCCLLYTSPSPRHVEESRMPSSA